MTFLINSVLGLFSPVCSGAKSNSHEFCQTPRFGQDGLKDFYNINICKVPPIPPALLRAWDEEVCPFWPERKVKETQIFALVLKEGNGKTLDLLKLLECVQEALPQSRQCLRPYIVQDAIQPALCQYDEAYWVLVTKLPVPGTSDLPSEEKAEYIRQQSNGQYAQASTMEATVCILAALANNEHVFGPELREYTECRETIESHPIRVGASLQGTLNYTYPLYSPIRCGAAAARIA